MKSFIGITHGDFRAFFFPFSSNKWLERERMSFPFTNPMLNEVAHDFPLLHTIIEVFEWKDSLE